MCVLAAGYSEGKAAYQTLPLGQMLHNIKHDEGLQRLCRELKTEEYLAKCSGVMPL